MNKLPLQPFEFDLTDLNEARRVLDSPPDGLIKVQQISPEYWTDKRRSAVPTDRALTGGAIDWFMSLPLESRPVVLFEQFPRVANRIAQVWATQPECDSLLDELLIDHRGGRRGFPAKVRIELEQLKTSRSTPS